MLLVVIIMCSGVRARVDCVRSREKKKTLAMKNKFDNEKLTSVVINFNSDEKL